MTDQLLPMGPDCGEPVSVEIQRNRVRHWVLIGTDTRGREQFCFALSLMPAVALFRSVAVAELQVRVEYATSQAAQPHWTFDLRGVAETLPTFDAVQLITTNEKPLLILTRYEAAAEHSVWIVGTPVAA